MNAREYYKQKYNREAIEEAPVRMTIGEILDLQDEFLQAVNKANEVKTSNEREVCPFCKGELSCIPCTKKLCSSLQL